MVAHTERSLVTRAISDIEQRPWRNVATCLGRWRRCADSEVTGSALRDLNAFEAISVFAPRERSACLLADRRPSAGTWTGEERFSVPRVVIRVGRQGLPKNHHGFALRARGDKIAVACDDLTHVGNVPCERIASLEGSRLQPPSGARG
jgi:hypothetical protein